MTFAKLDLCRPPSSKVLVLFTEKTVWPSKKFFLSNKHACSWNRQPTHRVWKVKCGDADDPGHDLRRGKNREICAWKIKHLGFVAGSLGIGRWRIGGSATDR